MKPWLVISVAITFVALIVLTLLFGDSAPKVDKNPIPKELPKAALGGGDVELTGDQDPTKEPEALGVLLSGELPPAGLEIELTGTPNPTPPLETPPHIAATDALDLADEDLVLGVTHAEAARAYPLKQLATTGQEILNDQLGGEPVVITWNRQLRSGVVFHNPSGDLTLVFRPTGQTWNSDLIFQDPSTESLWSQTLGRAVSGQLRGTPLRAIPSAVCTWKSWKQAYPETTVSQLPQTAPTEAVTNSAAARAAPRSTGRFLVICPEGELELPRSQLIETRVLNTTVGTRYAALFYDDLSDSIVALDPMLVVKPLTFQLQGLQFTLSGSNSPWNIYNGQSDEEGVTAKPLTKLLVLELPEQLQAVRRPTATPPLGATSGGEAESSPAGGQQ